MINILHIHTLPVVSGSGINTLLSMRGMDRSTFEVELACAPGGRLIDLVRESRMKVSTFPNLVQPVNPIRDIPAVLDLYRLIKDRGYHIVHTHNSKAGFLGRLAARLADVPVIIHTVHGFAFHDMEPLWRQTLFRNLERLASRWCDKMIFISQPLIDWALREGIGSSDKMIKIYSGIDLNRFTPVSQDQKELNRARWGLGKKDPVIGMVSKLWDGKGHTVLIEAFREIKKEMPDARLVIVGEGYLYPVLRGLAEGYHLADSILFTGFQMNVSELISTFDVAVLPSFFEGMGRVLLEAMAMERPVVASRVGGIPDLIKNGVNGLLTPPGDVRALADALKKVLSDKGLAHEMGRLGREMTTDQFNSDAMVRSIQGLYRECLMEKGIGFGN